MRIHFLFKLFVGVLTVGTYSWIIFDKYDFLYEVQFCVGLCEKSIEEIRFCLFFSFQISPSINASLNAKVAHVLIVVFITVIFHLIDRQSEYISRIDYK